MTVGDLKAYLEWMDEDAEVIVYVEDTSTVYEIDSACLNGTNLQLNAE